eukprot:COSAG06_NODE_27699_length_588_cov_0.740286_1_plen_88_part_00
MLYRCIDTGAADLVIVMCHKLCPEKQSTLLQSITKFLTIITQSFSIPPRGVYQDGMKPIIPQAKQLLDRPSAPRVFSAAAAYHGLGG